jgi:hypothetical protein
MKLTAAIAVGVFGAILGAFPIAALVALILRFRVPFGSYISGPSAIGPSVFAVFFYGIVGGFPVLAFLGAIGGGVAYTIGGPRTKHVLYLSLGFALVIDLLAALIMSV